MVCNSLSLYLYLFSKGKKKKACQSPSTISIFSFFFLLDIYRSLYLCNESCIILFPKPHWFQIWLGFFLSSHRRLFGKNKNTTTQDPDPDIKEELVAKLKARLRNYLIFDRERRKQIHRLEREVRCLKERLERERGEMKRARDELMRRYITQQQFREREEELRKGTVIIRGLRDVDERLGRVQDEVRGLMGEKLPDW